MFTGRTMSLTSLAETTSAEVMRDAEVGNVGKIPTNLTNRLVFANKAEHLKEIDRCEGIVAVVVPRDLAPLVPDHLGLAIAPRPNVAAIEIFEALISIENFHWADFPTRIAATAKVHPRAVIAERNVVIGERSFIDAGTVVRERTIIGDDCYIGALSVLAAEAFDLAPGVKPQRLLRQAGGVRLWNNSTVLCATMVARATFGGFTEIREGACVDNLVYIAHDVDIGANSQVIGCAEISGRAVLGENSRIGPNATISNGVRVGAHSNVSLGSVVVRDVPDRSRVSGNFAVPHGQFLINFIKSVSKRA